MDTGHSPSGPSPSSPGADGRRFARLALLCVIGAACAPAVTPIPATAPAPAPVEPAASVAELQAAMAEGRLTARQIAEAYLARIEALDRQGPELRAMLDLNPDALAIADSLDAERRAGRVRGPLHGVPVVIKDNIATADRMTTTAGSRALEGVIAPADAFVVQRLREAGAVLLGKTNLSEWANFRSTRSSSGWSGRGGQARNPYVLDRSPCGSSSGSAVAVAAGLAPLAIGTETDGSIVCPAGANGVVGIKPTIGAVSRTGIIPIAHSQDIAGPMARTVTDAALLLGAITGEDPADPGTRGSRTERDYTRFLDPGALGDARIGVIRTRMTGYHAPTDRLLDQAIADLRAAGAVVIDSLALPHYRDYGGAEWTILLHEFKHGLNRYLDWLGDAAPVRSLAELIEFNERDRERSMPFFGQEIFLLAEATEGLEAPAYLEALETARLAGVGIDSILRLHQLDALVAPTGSPAWPTDLVLGDRFVGGSSSPAAVAGYPNLTVPMGQVHGLPVGISFFGTAWSEPRLIALAYAYEHATGHRRPPVLAPRLRTAHHPPLLAHTAIAAPPVASHPGWHGETTTTQPAGWDLPPDRADIGPEAAVHPDAARGGARCRRKGGPAVGGPAARGRHNAEPPPPGGAAGGTATGDPHAADPATPGAPPSVRPRPRRPDLLAPLCLPPMSGPGARPERHRIHASQSGAGGTVW
jgi:amidase